MLQVTGAALGIASTGVVQYNAGTGVFSTQAIADTRIPYGNATTLLATSANLTWTSTTGVLASPRASLAQGTITAAAPVFSATATWNAGGVVFTALDIAVSGADGTGCAALSRLLSLKGGAAGADDRFHVDYNGATVITSNGLLTQNLLYITQPSGLGAGGTGIMLAHGAQSNSLVTFLTNTQLRSTNTLQIGTVANYPLEILTTGQVNVATGTVAVSTPILNLTQTWNDAAAGTVVFTGVNLTVTDTLSAAASLLLNMQVGATPRLTVTKNGITSISCPNNLGSDVTNLQVTAAVGGTTDRAKLALTYNAQTLSLGVSSLGFVLYSGANLWIGANGYQTMDVMDQQVTVQPRWNGAGTQYNGLIVYVQDTASLAASRTFSIVRRNVGGAVDVDILNITKTGITNLYCPNTLAASTTNFQITTASGGTADQSRLTLTFGTTSYHLIGDATQMRMWSSTYEMDFVTYLTYTGSVARVLHLYNGQTNITPPWSGAGTDFIACLIRPFDTSSSANSLLLKVARWDVGGAAEYTRFTVRKDGLTNIYATTTAGVTAGGLTITSANTSTTSNVGDLIVTNSDIANGRARFLLGVPGNCMEFEEHVNGTARWSNVSDYYVYGRYASHSATWNTNCNHNITATWNTNTTFTGISCIVTDTLSTAASLLLDIQNVSTSAQLSLTKAGVVYLHDRSAAPGSNPSNGGYLYVEAGALMYRGSGGTITTICPA